MNKKCALRISEYRNLFLFPGKCNCNGIENKAVARSR